MGHALDFVPWARQGLECRRRRGAGDALDRAGVLPQAEREDLRRLTVHAQAPRLRAHDWVVVRSSHI